MDKKKGNREKETWNAKRDQGKGYRKQALWNKEQGTKNNEY